MPSFAVPFLHQTSHRAAWLFLTAMCIFPAHAVFAKPLVCDARALGATGDGHTKDTAALQKAIDRCSVPQGGTVHLNAGTYVSAPLDWKSHVRIQLDRGATLLGSPDQSDYPIRADAPWRKVSLLHADHAQDISLTGDGVVDGNGKVWWDAKAEDKKQGRPEAPRPLLIDLTHAQHILIQGITLQNSPQYNLAAFLCNGLTVRAVKILNPGRTAPNTDGIDPVSTSNVLIEHTLIDTGDDNIAIKSGLVERGDPDVPSRNIIVRDCELKHGHGLSIGSETAGGVRSVTVERVHFEGTRQGIRIKSARGRGNDIGNFIYRNITMNDVETPIQITNYYTGGMKGDTAQPVTKHTPRFHDITIENVTATGANTAAVIFGLPESSIKHLSLRHVHISSQHGVSIQYAHIKARDFVITQVEGQAITKGPGVTMQGMPATPSR